VDITQTLPLRTDNMWFRARLGALAAGPFISLYLLGALTSGAYPGERTVIAAVNALAWSPLFFSIPALLLQRERDAFDRGARGLASTVRRSVLLIPHLVFSSRSAVRLESSVSLMAWVVLLLVSGTDVVAGLGMLF
jgi:hypothetical protein